MPDASLCEAMVVRDGLKDELEIELVLELVLVRWKGKGQTSGGDQM